MTTGTPVPGTLVLVRHGQGSFMTDDYDNLSDLGREQARRLGEDLARREARFDAAYAGPLRRQRDTALLVRQAVREAGGEFPELEPLPGLDEYAGIALARRLAPGLAEEYPGHAPELLAMTTRSGLIPEPLVDIFVARTRSWMRGEISFDDVEPWAAFLARVGSTLALLSSRHACGQRVIAFTSGGTIGGMLRHVLGLTDEIALDLAWSLHNASLTELVLRPDRAMLRGFNLVAHLPPAMTTHR